MADIPYTERHLPSVDTTLSTLITANHILDHYGLLDGFGHVSVRDPEHPHRFYKTGSTPPGFVSNLGDLAHHTVEDGNLVTYKSDQTALSPYSEHFIHSEIFRRYPEVNAVIHSHSRDVITFGITMGPNEMKPAYHMAAFLGPKVPVFDIAKHYSSGDPHNMLVNTPKLGEALANTLASSGGLLRKKTPMRDIPDHTACLQRGHGFTTWGTTIEEAVYRAYYTAENARITMDAAQYSPMQNPAGGVIFLSEREIRDGRAVADASAKKAWAYWSRVVEAEPRYRNDFKSVRVGDEPPAYSGATQKEAQIREKGR